LETANRSQVQGMEQVENGLFFALCFLSYKINEIYMKFQTLQTLIALSVLKEA